ncbi:MAG: lysophospholipid acyltransferase family protein [Chryseolinea sp.]
MKRATRFFRYMKAWCRTGLYVFFRRLEVKNAEAIPKNGPIIFIPTHQNAFIDAILVICTTPRNPWSIARASVFKEGLVTKLLTAIQIKPVFRVRDGFSSLKNNDAIMQEWTNMLAAGQDIMIFAEGNHNDPYASGTLQRGFARMALKFQQQHNIPLNIVPVGVYYDNHHSFRSRALVNFGNPIPVDEVLHASLNEREKLDNLVEVTESSLKDLALFIDPDENYQAKFDYLMKYRSVEKTMETQLSSDRKVLSRFPDPPATIKAEKQLNSWLKIINPVVWIGWLLHILPYSLIKGFIKKKVKEDQFIGSLKYAFGIFLIPIYYLILLLVFFLIYPSWIALLGFAILLPLSGIWTVDILKR